MADLPPPTAEAVVEYISSGAQLAGSEFAYLFQREEIAKMDALGKCKPDPIVYDDRGQNGLALFECRGDLGHFGTAIQFSIDAEGVKQASVMTINQIGGTSENG